MPLPNEPRIVTVIQARMASTRLPGKVLLPVLGKPLLLRMVERVAAARVSGQVVVATTTAAEDDAIYALCQNNAIACLRGHPTDLLDRHYQAGLHFQADAVVKIPSDCPLIDPAVIDLVLAAWLEEPKRCLEPVEGKWDFVSNLHPATWPDGNDVEVVALEALALAWREAARPLEREHTTPFFWENPERFRLKNVVWPGGRDFSMRHKWSLDYWEDYLLIRHVYESLYPANPRFGVEDVLDFLSAHPAAARLNERYLGVNWYRHHLNELKTVSLAETRAPAAA